MEKLVFDCEVISPLFLYGANQDMLEFRAPSFKGILRFWWRASQAENAISRLRKLEGEIFGGTEFGNGVYTENIRDDKNSTKIGRSSFIIRVTSEHLITREKALLPHKPQSPKLKAIVDQSFRVEFSFLEMNSRFTARHLQALFELTSLLGGIGKRSRRGFGSFRIVKLNDQTSEIAEPKRKEDVIAHILTRLNLLSDNKFAVEDGIIKLRKTVSAPYPFIETIAVGRSYDNIDYLLKVIGESSHANDCIHTGFVDKNGRLASPEYVSVIKGEKGIFWPVVSSLHLAFKPGFDIKKVDKQKQEDCRKQFKEAIL